MIDGRILVSSKLKDFPGLNKEDKSKKENKSKKEDKSDARINTISEYKIIREVLWMLRIPSNTYIFEEHGPTYIVKPGVSIPSLSKVSSNDLCTIIKRIIALAS